MIRSVATQPPVRQLGRSETIDHLARRLFIARAEKENGPSPELLAEVLREVVFLYALSGDVPVPVHVQSIINQVRRELAPIWPEMGRRQRNDLREPEFLAAGDDERELARSEESPIRRCLETLANVGDLQHVGAGYWLPTPIRLVQLADGPDAKALLIGGAPLHQLRHDGYASVAICGNIRALPLRVLPRSLREDDSAWQDVNAWLRSPSEPLKTWAAILLRRAAGELAQSHSDIGSFEVYDPLAHARDVQFFRWTPARLHEPDSDRLYLCRTVPTSGAGPRRYWLGRLSHLESGARPLSEYPVFGTDIRRLQYALDVLSGAPTRGSVAFGEESVEVTLSNYLPDPESRLLMAVGDDCSEHIGRLPLTYRIQRDVAEPVLDRIAGLGVQWR